ncbi:long-chain fatty acid--CoA ligase [Synechococcus sp. PCC 7336]|uniref:AMP-dependent synthetase/ligase n=1 Tax=Synechococcus sp. PCC 7336 TaxID=195250 RepID=UPI0003819E2D|nr:AMP-binding protein [Synechococcus sp. PCC 7336]
MVQLNLDIVTPAEEGRVVLGRTLPALLDEACEQRPNLAALNQWVDRQWQPLSTQALRVAAEELALGLLDLGVKKGDRVALFMESNTQFAIADMGCAIAGAVNVPIDLLEAPSAIQHILNHAEVKIVMVSSWMLLQKIAPYLGTSRYLKTAIVADKTFPTTEDFHFPALKLNDLTLNEVRARGRKQFSVGKRRWLRSRIQPTDLATIIYVIGSVEHISEPDRGGRLAHLADAMHRQLLSRSQAGPACDVPRGVALTHENITANILAAFDSHPDLKLGQSEVALSFLPLTHIFARAFLYGHLYYGHSVFFSSPERVGRMLRMVQPTIFITVPRLLEKAYERILSSGSQRRGVSKLLFNWSLQLAHRYEIGQPPQGLYALQLWLANRLVFPKWREAFGGKLNYLICGGAALRADIANVFSAANIPVLQGYGLTETSSVVCYNRGSRNRAGTVGVPIPGVELAIAADGEILVRSPYVMKGYYRDEAATRAVLDRDGWFHTGDLGRLSEDGFLEISGYKKELFKLSTGKYVSPQPLERYLMHSPFVDRAIAVGAHRKFCSMLIFPNRERLQQWAIEEGIETEEEDWLEHPQVLQLFQTLVDEANECLPYWSRAKQFQLVDPDVASESGIFANDRPMHRAHAHKVFAAAIDAIYSTPIKQLVFALAVPLTRLAQFAGRLTST